MKTTALVLLVFAGVARADHTFEPVVARFGSVNSRVGLVGDLLGAPADDWGSVTFVAHSTRIHSPGAPPVAGLEWGLLSATPLGSGLGTRIRVESFDVTPTLYPSGKYELVADFVAESVPHSASMPFTVTAPEPGALELLLFCLFVCLLGRDVYRRMR